MDIRAACLQAKTLDRDMFMKLPENQRVEELICKLMKPLYGCGTLNDASKKFWLSVKLPLEALGLKIMSGDDALLFA